ncbi:HBL215Cp [Eremothecium sinecaudum]|uniref:HBL215Cp n=1 Tax=Eremothecium sinecaudum TaxID=45286 RepID=A0A109UWM7_9SACH|nr:HBL215Cp [Eremothecium sinecaudum]AMD18687.1 HBL215Cp [Eremothecium sinecaudum]
MSKQFSHTTDEETSSVLYCSSVGKGGFFFPQDLISPKKRNEEAREAMLDDLGNADDTELLGELRGAGHGYGASSRQLSFDSQKPVPHSLIEEEMELLIDNHLYSLKSKDGKYSGSDRVVTSDEAERVIEREVQETWEQAVASGVEITTTLKREVQVLTKNSMPLVITFLLQQSLMFASVLSVAHLGAVELGGITVGSMTANITGIGPILGLSTCLDTLCAQAYGAERYHLVGLYLQRCVVIAMLMIIPIQLAWWFYAESLLRLFIPDPVVCGLAAQYLKVVAFSMPAFLLFEAGKRFLQCQGIFHASTMVLLVCAPLNALMNYLLVWHPTIGIGYLGAPLSVVFNYWFMSFGLLLYVLFTKHKVNPRKCWGGLIKPNQVFKNWNSIISLALPGIAMVATEFLGFEVLAIFASHISPSALGAHSIVFTVSGVSFQIPFSLSISVSTRVANLVGASLNKLSIVCCKAAILLATLVSIFLASLIFIFRVQIAYLFTSDQEVVEIVIAVLPILSLMQIFDSLNATTAGCLRGQGQQKIGVCINSLAFYLLGIPAAYTLGLVLGYGVQGLWYGIITALVVTTVGQSYFIFFCNWDAILSATKKRNSDDSF